MQRVLTALNARDLREIQDESQSDVIRFRVTPSLKGHIAAAMKELGVKDLSSFARGALLNAIELAKLGRDPKWRAFIGTVSEGPAKAILGHGLTLPDALDIEGLGRERKGLGVEELKRQLAKARKKNGSVPVKGV